jgi:molybdate transport system substrate-binding protein
MQMRLILALAALSVPSFAQLQVLTSGGFAAPLSELLPQFEKLTRIRVTTLTGQSQGSGPNTIATQLRRGVEADVVVMSREGLNDLMADSRIVRGSEVNLAQTMLGVAVRAGAPKPDLSTVETFKRTLLQAKSLNFPSTTGVYMKTDLLPRLGILDQVWPKVVDAGATGVARGAAEMSVQPVSEILGAPDVDFAGTIPPQVQKISVFSAAVVASSGRQKDARRLIEFLRSGGEAMRRHGMKPASAR